MENFSEKLIQKSTEQGSLVCVGMDPVIDQSKEKAKRLPDSLVEEKIQKHGKKEGRGEAVKEFFCNIIDGINSQNLGVATLKPNYAFYAQYGFSGLRALKSIIEHAHENDMMVLLDYKRGDIGKTSRAYANEGFEFWEADAITIAPYMGSDSVGPFIEHANKKGKGVYILNRTSNQGAKNLQNLTIKETDQPLYIEVSRCIKDEWSKEAEGSVGIVVGATTPQEYRNITGFFAETTIPQLIPGFGSQGGSVYQIFEGAIQTYQNKGFSQERIEQKLKTKRGSSSSGIDYAWNLIEGFDQTEYVEASLQAIEEFNQEIEKPLKEYGIKLKG